MAGPQYVPRDYSGGVVEGVQLTAEMGATDLSFTIANTTGWVNAAGAALGTVGPFTVVIDLGTPSVEKILCSSVNLSTGLVTVYNSGGFSGRGYDQTTAQSHVPGASPAGVQPCWSAVEAAEANAAAVFGPGGGGAVVGLTGNPAGRVYLTTTTGALTLGSYYQIAPCTTDYLIGSMTVASGGLVVPIAGKYRISAQCVVNTASGGQYETAIYKNGSIFAVGSQATGGASTITPAYSMSRTLAAGDNISFYVGVFGSNATSVTGGTGAGQTELSVELVSK